MGSHHHDLLHSLAEAAGISPRWHDHRGREHQVSPEALQAVLASLELEAGSAEQCRDSLDYINITEQRRIPSLTTGRSHQQLSLPAALQSALAPGNLVQLLPDDEGDPQSLKLETGPDGKAALPCGIDPGYYVLEAGSIQAKLAISPPACRSVAERTGQQRSYGLAAQIYSLRSSGDGGIGNFSALKDLARQSGQNGAQALAISPVHAIFSADKNRYSPYAPSSRLFLNALYADPAGVVGQDTMNRCVQTHGMQQELHMLEQLELIDWPRAADAKLRILRCLWQEQCSLLMAGEGRLGRAFNEFYRAGGNALQQHATFEAIHAQQYAESPERWHWRNWPESLRDPNSRSVRQFAAENKLEVGFHVFLQWLAAEGLDAAHRAGREAGMGVGLIADLAIGTDSGGSHAWSRQAEMLNGLSVGAPPDLINHQGQDWGLTTFSPRALQAHDYEPFLEMLRASLRYAGGLRIDHVLGLQRLWLVPDGAKATEGAYLSFPQKDLFNLIALESHRHDAIIVGEDLGTVPEGFRDQISDVGLLGMQVLWFERDGGLFVDPSRWRTDAMATTTTHDLPTVAGWWQARDIEWNAELDRFEEGRTLQDELADRASDRRTLWAALVHAGVVDDENLGSTQSEESISGETARETTEHAVDGALRYVAQTPSPLAIVPVEDILGLSEQPNLPGTIDEHPNWRRRLPVTVGEVLAGPKPEQRLSDLNQRSRSSTHAPNKD